MRLSPHVHATDGDVYWSFGLDHEMVQGAG
jgi:hypothetical protein